VTEQRPPAQPDEVDVRLLSTRHADGRTRAGMRMRRPTHGGVPAEGDPRATGRPLQALARVTYGPVPLDFEQLAARIPAVQWGLTLAGDADLELHLACVDQQELREVVTGLRRAGAVRIQVELILRTLVPGAVSLPATTMARSTVA